MPQDRDLRMLYFNEAFAAAHGRRLADSLGRTDIENGWDPDERASLPALPADGSVRFIPKLYTPAQMEEGLRELLVREGGGTDSGGS